MRVHGWVMSAVALALAGCNGSNGSDYKNLTFSAGVGGTVTGLEGEVTLVLNGAESLRVSADGAFRFSRMLTAQTAYSVTVGSQPAGQNCSVTNGTGTMANSTINNIVVSCAASTHPLGGHISGLIGTITLANGSEVYTTSTDGTFEFDTPVEEGAAYSVSVQAQPATQTCSVSHGAGTMGGSAIDNVTVVCSTHTFAVAGSVSGLMGTVLIRNNGGDELALSSNGAFEFPIAIAHGSPYAVTIQAQPATQTCSVSHGTGTVTGDVSDVAIVCSNNGFNLGGLVSGLHGTVVLQNNGADDLSINNDGPFTFSTGVAQGSPYNVTVFTQPASSTCVVSNGSGVMGSTDIANVTVNCSLNATTLSVVADTVVPVHTGSGLLTVTNTGSSTAVNIGIDLPPGWTSVVVDASDCVDLAPGASCNLEFTSSAPYVAKDGIEITADNVSSPPTTTLGFSIDSYLVFAVESASAATVIDNNTQGNLQWADLQGSTTANSLTNGKANTLTAVAELSLDAIAAKACNNSAEGGAAPGTWYLPAICQLSSSSSWASCPAGLPNIWDNLFRFGLNPVAQGTYWSSTDSSFPGAWNAQLTGSSPVEMQDVKPNSAAVVCVRSMSY
ncbi:NEW3 domain-containing protein [Peristeroidobacter soli]|uniref:NEW3 domain-containing protein n=1 Tax=Peristeroidobacter soli TaxID=2497877 RepID=UPI00130026A6|nr:NEW3 domain-containing protein [Peristeroidobacter soli]